MKMTEYNRKMVIVLFWVPIVFLATVVFSFRYIIYQNPFIILVLLMVLLLLLLLLIKPDIFKAFSNTMKTSIIAISVSTIFFLFRDVMYNIYYITNYEWISGILNLFSIFEDNRVITFLISVAILLLLIKKPDIFKILNDNLNICVATLLISSIYITFSLFLYELSMDELFSFLPAFLIPPLCFIILRKVEILESKKQMQHSDKCPKCGAKTPDNARFCDECGELLR